MIARRSAPLIYATVPAGDRLPAGLSGLPRPGRCVVLNHLVVADDLKEGMASFWSITGPYENRKSPSCPPLTP